MKLCLLITACTCMNLRSLRDSSKACVSAHFSFCLFQVSVVRLWWPRILQSSRWVKDRRPHWTVIWTPSLLVLLDGINRSMEGFHSLSYISTIHTLLLRTDPATPLLNSTQITKLNQIIVWSSVMWMWMILQCITVRHGTALLVSSYHSDSQHDKTSSLLAFTSAFCLQTLSH